MSETFEELVSETDMRRPTTDHDVEDRTQHLVAGINGLTFAEGDDNDDYVRKITPLIRTAIREAIKYGRTGRGKSNKDR